MQATMPISKKKQQPQPRKNAQTEKNQDLSISPPSNKGTDASKQEADQQSGIFLFDGSFDISQLTRELWLDHRRSVQNGIRSVRCDGINGRYMCTSRHLREWDENEIKRITKRFKEIILAQSELSELTPFVQSVIAAKIHHRDLLVITPLPSNMYLCDLKKLVIHFSHSTVRYYASCILLGLEFLRHRAIYHGNLSLSSIALDHYGRPQITDFDALLYENIGDMSHQLEALRFAALIGVLHCDNLRHFSVSHMHSTSNDSGRKDLFKGICPKCRLSTECMDPKLCDCKLFGSLVRFIMSNIVTRETVRRILESLCCTWLEVDLRYSWSRVPKSMDKPNITDFLRSDGQLLYPNERFSSRLIEIEHYDEFDAEYDPDAVWQSRQSRRSVGIASSAGGTAVSGRTGGQGAYSNKSGFAASEAMAARNERHWQRLQELEQSRVGSTSKILTTKLPLFGLSSDSLSKSIRDSNRESVHDSVLDGSTRGSAVQDQTAQDEQIFTSAPTVATKQLGKSQGQREPETPLVSTESPSPSPPLKPRSAKPLPPQPLQSPLQAAPPPQPQPPPSQSSKYLPPQSSSPRSLRANLLPSSNSNDMGLVQTNKCTDSDPQDCSSRTVWMGTFAGSSSSRNESNCEEAKIKSSHNLPIATLSDGISEESEKSTEIRLPSASIVGFGSLMSESINTKLNEFMFDGYQRMMRHPYFQGTNWTALDMAQSPEGFWFAHSLIMQSYTREAPPPRTADNVGDEADRVIGSYFTSRSRILYNMFG